MNRWLLIHRLRWPALVILFGITALLNQWDVLSFGQSWPLYLILLGLLSLSERAALAAVPPPQFPGQNISQPPPYGAPGNLQTQVPWTSSPGANQAGSRSIDEPPAGGDGRA